MVHQGILLPLLLLSAAPGTKTADAAGVIRWHGDGVQIYDCAKAGNGYAWTLRQPDALLTDATGRISGHHGAGPSWTATDGSSVVGHVVTTIPAPRPGAIPWLVLQAAAHDGHGTLDDVTYVLRTETVGGVAPAGGCSQDHAGAVVTVPYQATYSFLHPTEEVPTASAASDH